jgi:hypothetical protein
LFIVTATVFRISPVHHVGDSYYSMLLGEHVLHHGDFHLDAYFDPPFDPRRYPGLIAATGLPFHIARIRGHLYYVYGPGSSVLSLPFIAIANAAGVSTVDSHGGYDPDSERLIQATLAAVLMAGLVVLFFLTARLCLPPGASLVIAVAGGFGTPIWSTASRVLWSHTWETLLLGLLVLILAARDVRGTPLRPLVLATLGVWMYLTRPTGAVPLLTVSAYILVVHRDIGTRYVLTCAAWLTGFVVWSAWQFGDFLPGYYLSSNGFQVRGFPAQLAGVLVSPSRGLLVFVPVLFFVAYLVLRYWRLLPFPRLVVLAIVTIAAHILLVSTWVVWWGGYSYGPRLLTDLVPWFVLVGIAGVVARTNSRRAAGTCAFRGGGHAELLVGTMLLVLTIGINARGALVQETWCWNVDPIDADSHLERLWDWSDPQFLAGLARPVTCP